MVLTTMVPNLYTYVKWGQLQEQLMEKTDIRMDYLKNVIANLKYIKSRALETFYLEKLY